MQVKHQGPERVLLAALGVWVEPDEPVDVADDVAASLIDQGWVIEPDGPSRSELVELAEAAGVEVRKSWSAARIAQAIEEAADSAAPAADDDTSEED